MFIELLSNTEKETLIELVIVMAEIDGEISNEEMEILQKYSTTLDLTYKMKEKGNIEKSLKRLASFDEESQKIIYAELCKLMMIDGIDKEEMAYLSEIKSACGLSQEKHLKIIKTINKIMNLEKEFKAI